MKRLLPLLALLCLSARADVLPGLEAYGDLTLVDEVDCATDTTHEFHELPEGASSVQTILGSPCRVLPHPSGEAGFFSYRLGKGKGLVAHDMYLLVVEYPDDVPRTASLLNRAMNSRNGWHTGNSVGETMVAHIIGMTHPESMDVPLSGAYKRLEQVMFLNENVFPYNTTDSYMGSEANGFDVIVHAFSDADSPDSAGPAVRAIRLYRMNDEKSLAAPVNYPAGGAPKRHVTWRDEMGKHNAYSSNANQYDNFRMKMRLMRQLGLDTWSRDLLEFGYNQNWDIYYANRGGWFSSSTPADRWTTEVDIYGEAGIYLLPFYEYAGGRGPSGFGVDGNADHKCIPMDRGGYGGHYNLFVANANGASGANIDITSQGAYDEFAAILDSTILRYKDKANFLGAWIRNRGSMPFSFSEATRNRFCADTGRASGSVSIDDLSNKAEFGSETFRWVCKRNIFGDLYKEYRTWWYGKRADWLSAMQKHLEDGGIADAKVFFSGVWGEAGLEPHNLVYYDDYYNFVARQNEAWDDCGYTGTKVTIGYAQDLYKTYGLDTDSMTWFPDEYNHAAPRNDPETYTNRADVAICYPYNTVYTTIPAAAANYRNASGDLFFSRHFCLYEGCGNGVGYFTTEMDRCGRAIMLPELHAMAYQDPTLIGFMQGGHLARNCTKEFREFNEYFLSLPAAKGTVLRGGGWGVDDVTVRRYQTSAGDYYAVVNTSYTDHPETRISVSGVAALYDTVTGERVPVSSGSALVPVAACQMRCFSTIAPDTPRFLVAVPSVGSSSAQLPLAVSTLGGSSATLRVSYSTSPAMAGAVSLPASTLTSAGTNTVSLAGLSPNTTYYVTFGLTNALAKGAAHVLSFTTDTASTHPRGTMEATADVNQATLAINLTNLGDDASSCDLYAVLTPSAPGLAAVTRALGTRTAIGACSFAVGPLSSEAVYNATLFATNNLGYGVAIATASITTLPKPAAASGAGAWADGLVQAKFDTKGDTTSAIATAVGAARVPGAAMAGIAATEGTAASNGYTNPYDGQSTFWNAKNTTFGYAGEMFFEAGRTYTIGKCFDDAALVRIAGAQILEHTAWNGSTTATYSPTATGWAPIEIRVWDGDGGKGPAGNWASFVGLAWSTNASPTISTTTTGWIPFMSDSGAPLRCRSSIPPLVSLGTLARNGSALVAPVTVDSYDEDNVLAVYATASAPAAGEFDEPTATAHDFVGWASAAGATPAIGLGQSQTVSVSGLSFTPGTTVYAVARLVNARTGYDVCSAAATYVVPDDTSAPEFGACGAQNVAWNAATLSFALSALGAGSSSVDVTWTIAPGSTGGSPVPGTLTFTATGTKTASLSGLAADTTYTVAATATGTNGKTATTSFAFRTATRSGPAATLAVGTVGFTDAAFTVNVSSFGTDAANGTVRVEVLDGSTVVWSQTQSVDSTGAVAFSATGLTAGRALSVRATVTSPAGSLALGPTSFSTAAFGAPVFGACEAANVSWDSATLSFALSALGAGSSGVTVSWTLSPAGGSSSPATLAFASAGAQTASVSGLAPETAYTVSLVATGTNGRTAETSFAFTTLRLPLVLSEASGVCNGAGTEATAKATVTRADRAATLALYVEDALAKTWTAVEAGSTYSFAFPIEVGQTKAFRFVLSADGCTDVEKTGAITGRQVVDWFNVPLNDAAYANWTLASGPDAYEPSATWTVAGENNASAIVSDGAGGRELSLGPTGEGSVAYAPAFPSEDNRTLEVSGTAKLRANAGVPPAPDGSPLAGIALGVAEEAPALFGWTAGGWTALAGTAPAAETSFAWKAVLDFENGTVAYYADDTALAAAEGGATALPLGMAAATHAEQVVFYGSGAIGPFRGVYADAGGGSVRLWAAAIRVDGTGLSFTTVGDSEKFVIGLKEARAGAYYVAFAADSLDTPADDWVCVACSSAPAVGGENIDLPCSTVDGQGNPIPAQFFKIYAAGAAVDPGTRWGDCDFVAGE